MEEFTKFLKSQTNLNPRSVKVYVRIVKRYLSEHGEARAETMNEYIKKSSVAKFAFRYYLKFINKREIYADLIKIKVVPVRREGVFLEYAQLQDIVSRIADERYRMAGIIQLQGGIRASETLSLPKKAFTLLDNGKLRVRVIGKGGKENIIRISQAYAKQLWDYICSSESEYPFMRLTSEDMTRCIETNYHYYYLAVRKAAEAVLGIRFGTHDFKRNFVDHTWEITKDLRATQRAANHSKLETTLRYIKKRMSEEEYEEVQEKVRG